jgi:sirohydrochlorin ferrochelatase
MRIALVDNGSLEPAAHESLRTAAARLSGRTGAAVEPVSWRHSDRIPAQALGGQPAWTLAPWIRACLAEGEREFAIVPYFVSPRGAIATLLRRDLESLRSGGPAFTCPITDGLEAADLSAIAADRVREVLGRLGRARAPVMVVDHGGPSAESLALRNQVAGEVAQALAFGPVIAASMEVRTGRVAHGPLFSEALASPGLPAGDVIIAPLFLAPGRHAGPQGDLAGMARDAERRRLGLRCHFADLIGSHPLAEEALAAALANALALQLPR